MDPIVPELEKETRRRRRRLMFSHSRVPVRMLVPNVFTLLGLCAGLTSIRMSIEGRWEFALALIVFAALLDGVDGRIARLLKASSRFGAELDSLADFVNFGVAPAVLIFTWGLGDVKSGGWIAVLIFALASAMRLARFNVASSEDKPKWQSDYFMGMPTPAAAIVVLLPFYVEQLGVDVIGSWWALRLILVYTLVIAIMMVSNVPTYSGKLLGERIGREWVLPIFIAVVAVVAHLVTFPYATLTVGSLVYLLFIPATYMRFRRRELAEAVAEAARNPPSGAASPGTSPPSGATGGEARVVDLRPNEQKR